jgi:SAM-dependent methyltransferase
MTRSRRSLPPDYFETLYQSDPDPWCFAGSAYERGKYGATLAALPRPRYGRALEVGCSIGVLTADLASRCDALLAVDAAETALTEARRRCAGLPNLAFRRLWLPDEWPVETGFDLILLSEVVYYLVPADVARLAALVQGALRPGGDVLLVHWTGETDYPLAGDAAADLFIASAAPAVGLLQQQRHAQYRIDLLRAAPEVG